MLLMMTQDRLDSEKSIGFHRYIRLRHLWNSKLTSDFCWFGYLNKPKLSLIFQVVCTPLWVFHIKISPKMGHLSYYKDKELNSHVFKLVALVIRDLINDLFSLTSRIKQNFFHWSSCHSKLSCCTSKWQMVAFSLNYCFLRSEYSSSLGTLSWEQSSSQINCFIKIRISLSDLRSFENWHFLQFVSFWHNR